MIRRTAVVLLSIVLVPETAGARAALPWTSRIAQGVDPRPLDR